MTTRPPENETCGNWDRATQPLEAGARYWAETCQHRQISCFLLGFRYSLRLFDLCATGLRAASKEPPSGLVVYFKEILALFMRYDKAKQKAVPAKLVLRLEQQPQAQSSP